MAKHEIKIRIELPEIAEYTKYNHEYIERLVHLEMMEKLKDKIVIEQVDDNTWTGKLVVLSE